ncbi:unnamed protein product [Somion occarium]|uniref:Ricin B lectin domain-containing protein n=1 Tax=Somion occarium TaxID=3059160 RepID=A0ABP1D4W9_9APHY
MIGKTFTKLALLGVGFFYSVAAKPALPIPTSGTYRIQNADTGLYIDAFESLQDPGTPVIVFPLNEPATANQQWTVILFDPPFGELQSISSFVTFTGTSGNLVATLDPSAANVITFSSTPGGVSLCGQPTSVGCLTSPSTGDTQIPLLPFTGALNQTWIFQPV